MARQYAKFYVTVWGSDFRQLTRGAQHLYFQLVSNPKLSAAGCVTIQPRKWANQSADTTPAEIEADLSELAAKRYVLIDDDTEELLVRSFIHHDRGYRNKYLLKSIETAIAAIESPALRDHARLELAAALEPESDQLEDSEQDSYEDPSEDPYELPNNDPTHDAYEDTSQDTTEANYRLQPQHHLATSPAAAASNAVDESANDSTEPPQDVAAAALEILIQHKLATSTRTSEGGYRRTLERDLPGEWGDKIREYLRTRPLATAEGVAHELLGVPRPAGWEWADQTRPEWHYDPNCQNHGTDGWENLSPEGTAATYAPCRCRREYPYDPEPMADVIEFSRREPA